MKSLLQLPIRALASHKLSVFLFHKVPSQLDPLMPQDMDLASFEKLLDSVMQSFQVIPVSDAVAGLISGKLPPRAACITFDDGYPGWRNGVIPALERRNMHATFYITAGQFSGRPLWHERIANVVRHSTADSLDIGHPAFPAMPLTTPVQRTAVVIQLERFLKYLTLDAREELLQRLESLAGAKVDDVPRMSIEDLKAIHARGFEIGAHTDDHPILVYCTEERAKHEIGAVREVLAGHVGTPIKSFAYPNGRPFADFSSLHVDMVKRAGYTSAVTTQWGVGGAGTSVFQIPRFTPWGKDPLRIALQLGRNLMTNPDCVDE